MLHLELELKLQMTITTTMRYLHLAKTAMREAVNVVSIPQFGTTTTATTKAPEQVETVER